jgi:hypothetical protein
MRICRSSGACEMWENEFYKHPAPLALRTDNVNFNDFLFAQSLFNSGMTSMLAAGTTGAASPAPTAQEIRGLLERILSSKQFSNAPKKQKFLQLICETYMAGRADELNEYLIGYEVFNRHDTYNPALDPIVRVGAHELRKKLERYYKSEGKNDEILLEIPVGSYIPIFTRRPLSPETNEPAQTVRATPVSPFRLGLGIPWITLIGSAFVLLIVAVILLASSNRQLQQQIKEGPPPKELAENYRLIWEPFLKDESPTLVVLSNPTVYRFWNQADPESLSARSINLTAAETDALAKTLGREQFALKHNLLPRLVPSSDEYTGLGEAVGLYRIATLFNGIDRNIRLKQSRTVSAEDLKNNHVILLGSVWVNEWSGKISIKEDFISSAGGTILNQNPLPGEQREYSARFDGKTGKLIEDYSLITVKPNISEKNTVMVLAGTHSEGTEAAAEYLTGEDRLAALNKRLFEFESGPPRYFQVLLKVAIDNGIPTTISTVTIHKLNY